MSKIILIVDDHEEFRKMLKDYLTLQYPKVYILEVPTGEEAIELSVKERPQVVLMDYQLPNMDGIQASERIKKMVSQCQIILLSIYEIDESIRQFKGDVIDAFINKNDLDKKLTPLLNRYLDV